MNLKDIIIESLEKNRKKVKNFNEDTKFIDHAISIVKKIPRIVYEKNPEQMSAYSTLVIETNNLKAYL